MYNRYIPQPDGSYRKNRIPDPCKTDRPLQRPMAKPEPAVCQDQIPNAPADSKPCQPVRHADAGDFLRRLLPKELDTGDLLIILLLLLMAGDCKEDKNTALLTLALYFFL